MRFAFFTLIITVGLSLNTPAYSEPNTDDTAIKAWVLSQGDGFVSVISKDDTLGLSCKRGTGCFSALKVDFACDTQDRVPGIINSPGGSLSVTVRCLPSSEETILIVEPFDTVRRIVKQRSEGILAIAVPTQGGRFNVTRFSLMGSFEAISLMDAIRAEWR